MAFIVRVLSKIPLINKVLLLYHYFLFLDLRKFKDIKYDLNDRELLATEIRKTAHILEKDLYALDKPLFVNFEKRLIDLLERWNNTYEGNEPTIIWAKGVLLEHKKITG